MAFSKFKADLKRRAARTVTELWEAIGLSSPQTSAKTGGLLDMTVRIGKCSRCGASIGCSRAVEDLLMGVLAFKLVT